MKTILLAGGAGYIGSVLAKMLLEAGHRVRVLDRFFFGQALVAPLLKHPNLETIHEDTRFAGRHPFVGVDVVIDLSGICNDPACDLHPEITKDINLNGTLNLAQQAKVAGVSRFIFASSCSVYGFSDEILTEESPTNPVSLYAQTKLLTEQKLRGLADDKFCITFMRLATVYGVSYRMRFDLVLNIMTLCAHRDRKIQTFGGGQQWRPLVHIRDVARALILASDASPESIQCEVFNVGANGQNYQVSALTHLVREVFPYTEIGVVLGVPDKRSYQVNFDKIQRVLGFRAQTSCKEGILEIKRALETGKVEDSIQTRSVALYKHLLETGQLVSSAAKTEKFLTEETDESRVLQAFSR